MEIPVKQLRKRNKVFIIAEAGVNHDGSVKIAKKMVDAAKRAGADAVKFQTFQAKNLAAKSAPRAAYQRHGPAKNQTQLEMLEKLELNIEAHKTLLRYCRARGIMFLSSPFDLESIDLLNRLGLALFKIPSGEITNLPYLRKIGSLKKKIIISTGMSDLGEIKQALDILRKAGTPRKNLTVLHCHSSYPTAFKDVNLLAMLTIKNTFKVDVGYSDHTLGIEAPVAAVALGAAVIEKHFTLDRNMDGPDQKASLEPDELAAMVEAIRNIEKAFGSGIKKPALAEIKNMSVARKSIVAARKIKKGEYFSAGNITTKRPGNGISPLCWDKVITRRAKKDFSEDELIRI